MAAIRRTARVFISSTFRDIHAARDRLVKVVLPERRGPIVVEASREWAVMMKSWISHFGRQQIGFKGIASDPNLGLEALQTFCDSPRQGIARTTRVA
jgi:hypothetical protein